ncbi:MAG: hypothetical protein KGQ51_18470, partial [Planctomycetes bacterium]|nr:hypothetical protein [Planctomycetota bacterium]
MPVLEVITRRLSALQERLRRLFHVREPTLPTRELDLQFLEDRILYSGVALAPELVASEQAGTSADDSLSDTAPLNGSPNPDAFSGWGWSGSSHCPSDSIAQIEASLQELDTLLAELTSQQTPQESDEGTTVDVPDISSEP